MGAPGIFEKLVCFTVFQRELIVGKVYGTPLESHS